MQLISSFHQWLFRYVLLYLTWVKDLHMPAMKESPGTGKKNSTWRDRGGLESGSRVSINQKVSPEWYWSLFRGPKYKVSRLNWETNSRNGDLDQIDSTGLANKTEGVQENWWNSTRIAKVLGLWKLHALP